MASSLDGMSVAFNGLKAMSDISGFSGKLSQGHHRRQVVVKRLDVTIVGLCFVAPAVLEPLGPLFGTRIMEREHISVTWKHDIG